MTPDTEPRFRPRPWTPLASPHDVEAWIAEHNACMQEMISPRETGAGVCFALTAGGQLFLQTRADAIVLDLPPDAEWIAPLITAATGAQPPKGQLWILPDDTLVQLVLGLSPLVQSTVLVTGHYFGNSAYR